MSLGFGVGVEVIERGNLTDLARGAGTSEEDMTDIKYTLLVLIES
jgi:hypothetical protein